MSSKAVIRRRLDRSDPGSFSDVSTRAFKAGAVTFRSTRRVEGTIANDGRTWRGSYRERTKLFEDGEQIDTCRLRTTWRVR